MAVIAPIAACNISDASAFYRCEAYNLSTVTNLTRLTLTGVGRQIAVTPANAGNLTTFIASLDYATNAASSAYKDVVTAFQQNLGTVTITIASPAVATLVAHGLVAGDKVAFSTTGSLPTNATAAQIFYVIATGLTADAFQFSLTAGGAAVNTSGSQSGTHSLWKNLDETTVTSSTITCSAANATGDFNLMPDFATTPAFTAVASTYRFNITLSGAQANNPTLTTSNGTAPFYVMVGDTAVSFTANDIVVMDRVVTWDANSTIVGDTANNTGDTTYAIAGIVCSSTTAPTEANSVGNMVVNGGVTVTVNGNILRFSYSAIRAGTSASSCTVASPAKITFSALSSGTLSGIRECLWTTGISLKSSWFTYGDVITYPAATVAANAAAGQPVITTVETTGWTAGTFMVDKQNTAFIGDVTIYTISSVVTTTITATSNFLTYQRLAGGRIYKLEDTHGVIITGNGSNTQIQFSCWSNAIAEGTMFKDLTFVAAFSSVFTSSGDSAANVTPWRFDDCMFLRAGVNSVMGFLEGVTYTRCDFIHATSAFSNQQMPDTGALNFVDCHHAFGVTTFLSNASKSSSLLNIDGLTVRNSSLSGIAISGGGGDISDLEVFGSANSAGGGVVMYTSFNLTGDNWTIDQCGTGIRFNTVILDFRVSNISLGQSVANTQDTVFTTGAYVKGIFESPTGSWNINITDQSTMVPGSRWHLVDYNDTSNDDRTYLKEGNFQRTGYLQTDTTVWTGTAFGAASASQFALRLQPNSGVTALVYGDNVFGNTTIGNNQNKTVTVNARIKINSANYYAGTHVKPTLRVTYDGTSVATPDVADGNTNAQQLQVSFTPLTTTEAITITLEGASDATGTTSGVPDACFYIGELYVANASGVVIDTTTMSKWVDGLPQGTFRTIPTPASPWDSLTTNHTVSGSFGKIVGKLLTVLKFLGLK